GVCGRGLRPRAGAPAAPSPSGTAPPRPAPATSPRQSTTAASTPNSGPDRRAADGGYNTAMLTLDPHPLLDLRAFITRFPRPLGEMSTLADLARWLDPATAAPLVSDDTVREAVRKLLRQGGFKPTGRSKPASEYLLRAVQDQQLSSINLAVDVCNVVSLHSGLPVSVVDLDRARPPFRVGIAPVGSSYVFNASGQNIDLGGLLCLFDAEGPCATAVKDAQRTKTGADTRSPLSLIGGTTALPGRAAQAARWYRELLERAGAGTEAVVPGP